MTLLCPSAYIPSNISNSRNEIEISLDSVNGQLLAVYKEKAQCDMVLKLNAKEWRVHVYVIEQHSDIFWKGLVKKQDDMYVYQLNVNINNQNEQNLYQVLDKLIECLYGSQITIRRCDINTAYTLCKSLHLTQLLDHFHADMLINYQQYDIFPLLQLANEEKIIDVITMCYEHLEMEHFEQIRYNKSGLLVCEPDLFRTVLKRHNFLKFQRGADNYGLASWEAKSLVEEYCLVNGIKGRRKERFLQEIQGIGALNNSMRSQNQSIYSPVKRIYTCTRISAITSLKEIKQQPQEQEYQSNFKTKRKPTVGKCVSFAMDNRSKQSIRLASLEEFSVLEKKQIKSQIRDISDEQGQQEDSCSNCSISPKPRNSNNKNKMNTSLNLLISDPKTILTLTNLSSSLQTSLKSSTQIQKKASDLVKSLKGNIKRSKQRTSKIELMENQLDEIWAEIKTGKQRLGEVERTVHYIEERQKLQNVLERRRCRNIIQTSIELDLTISKEFGTRHIRRPC